MIQVVIADDHALYKAAVKAALSSKKDIKIIGEADNGHHLLNLLEAEQPDVILLDIKMPIMDGIATLAELKKLYPNIRVIMLTMFGDQTTITKLLEMGANGYLSKTSDSSIIYEAIKNCYEHEFYFNTWICTALQNNLRQRRDSSGNIYVKDATLSEREIVILRLMCEEKNTSQIAEAVNLSPRTIESLRDILKVKTGAKNIAGLIMYAIKNELLD